jgi:hypothetical protein
MTVALLSKWGDQPPGTLYTSDANTEAAMIAAKVATATLAGAVAWVPNTGSPNAREFNASEKTALQAVVSGGGSDVWANRAAIVAAGQTSVFFTDVGVGGSYWDYVGGRWRPQARNVVLKNTITPASNITTTKTVLDYAVLLPGLVQDGDVLQVAWLKERTGGTADTDTTDTGLGTVPATFGTSFGLSTAGLATTNRQVAPAPHLLRRESATAIRPISVGGATGTGQNTGANTSVTVPNMDSQTTYLQITSQLTTGGTETAWLRGFVVTLIAGA